MATYSRVKTWSSNETLTSADLNAEFNNIITNTNSGSLNSDNVSTSAAWTWTGTHTMSTSSKLAFIDNIYLTMGSATDGDYLLRYSASNTALELSTTNSDGSGTDAVVIDIQDGTDDVRVRGGFSTDNNTAPTTGIKVGGNIVSDTDSTDDLGTTSVRWANVYTDAVGDSGQTLGVKATTLSFDAASTIDTSGNNALTLDAGSAVLTLDGGTLESDASTLSFDAAATIDTSGNNNLTLSTGTANVVVNAGVLDVSGDADIDGTLEADAITLGGTALGSLYSPIAGSSSIVTVGTIGTGTWQGTDVGVAHGGTGLSTVGTNQILTGNGTGALTSEANLTFDGQILDLNHASSNPTLTYSEGGTERGSVAYVPAANELRLIAKESGSSMSLQTANSEAIYISSSQQVGIGSSAPTATLEVAAGAIQKVGEFWGTEATSFLVVSSDAETQNNQSGITFNATKGNIIGSAHSVAGIAGKVTNSGGSLTGDMIFNVNAGDDYGEKMRLTSSGALSMNCDIGSRTADLTIKQTKLDVAQFNDPDVAHGMTSLTNTDTFGALANLHGTEGGILMNGYAEGTKAIGFGAWATTSDSTKSTSAVGAIYWDCGEKNGTDVHAFDSNDNLMVITNRTTARFIFDADGDGHADSAWTTFDKHDDIAMLHDIEATMVPDTFGKAMKYDAPYLEKIGIIGAGSLREENGKTRGMINYTRLSMLHHGAIRQVHQQLQDVKDFYEDKLAALEARLLRLEA